MSSGSFFKVKVALDQSESLTGFGSTNQRNREKAKRSLVLEDWKISNLGWKYSRPIRFAYCRNASFFFDVTHKFSILERWLVKNYWDFVWSWDKHFWQIKAKIWGPSLTRGTLGQLREPFIFTIIKLLYWDFKTHRKLQKSQRKLFH